MTESEVIKDNREELGGKIGDRGGQEEIERRNYYRKEVSSLCGGLGTRGPSANLCDLYMLCRSCPSHVTYVKS